MPPAPLTILFAGTSAFAVPSLKALLSDPRFKVTSVITQPDKPVGRKQVLTPPPVKVVAEQAGIPVFQPASLNKEFAALKAGPRPDFLVVISYGQILSDDVLAFPLKAPINVHASLLPAYRGASPIQHAILHNDAESGVSIQRMVKELDAGPVYASKALPIGPRETFRTLHDALAALAVPLLIETLASLPKPVAQDDGRKILCGKLKREDGVTDPSTMTAAQIDTKVRALVPWPGVTWNDTKLIKTALEPHPDAMPLSCAGGTTLYLMTVQPAGRKAMTGAEYGRGKR